MADDQVSVSIVADASGVAPGVEIAKEGVGSLESSIADLTATMQAMTSQMVAAMGKMSESMEQVKAEVKEVEEESEAGFRAMIMQVHEGVESFNEFKAGLSEIAEVYMTAFAVEQIADWAKEMAEAAEKVEHLAETFGMTTQQVQQLGGIADATGMPIDAITKAMQVLDKNAVAAASGASATATAFKAVGIAADDGKTQMEKLEIIAGKFQNMEDGPKKVALAMELFGRAGAEMIPLLNRGAAGIEEINAKSQKYGVVSKDATTKGMELAESFADNRLAMAGLSNTMASALAPAFEGIVDGVNGLISAFVQSYNQGGTVAVVMGAIAGAIDVAVGVMTAFGDIIEALVQNAIVPLTSAVMALAHDAFDALQAGAHEAGGVIDAMVPIFRTAADIMLGGLAAAAVYFGGTAAIDAAAGAYAFALSVSKQMIPAIAGFVTDMVEGGIPALIAFGQTAVAAATEASAAFLAFMATNPLGWIAIGVGVVVAALAHFSGILDPIIAKLREVGEWIAKFTGMDKAIDALSKIGEVEKPKETKPETPKDFDPKLGADHKEKAQKAPKDDLVAGLEDQLEAQKTTYAMQQDAQGTYQAYSLQSEEQYWAAALARTDLSAKDKLQIEQKWLAVRAQLHKEEVAKGEESAKGAAQIAEAQAKNEIALARITLQGKIEAIDEQEKAGQISGTRAVAQRNAVNAQLYALDAELESRIYAAKLAEFQAEQKLYAQDTPEYKKIADQIVALETAHDAQMVNLNAQKNQKIKADNDKLTDAERSRFQTMATDWGNALGKMATMQQTFAKTVEQMYMSLVNVAQRAISQMVTHWIEGMLVKEGVSKAADQKERLRDAWDAARKAYRSQAAIPVIGPALGAAAAVAAFATVEGFSAAGGWDNVPYDGAQTTLHKNEMVLPASIASPLRSMIATAGINDNAASSALGGGHTFNFNLHSPDSDGIQRMLTSEAGQNAIIKSLGKAVAGLKTN